MFRAMQINQVSKEMALVLQKCVCSVLLVSLCLSFSFAHRHVLDHSGNDYRKQKATVISGPGDAAGYGSRNIDDNGRGVMSWSVSRVGSGSMALGKDVSGGSATGTHPRVINIHPMGAVPQMTLMDESADEDKEGSKTTQGNGGEIELTPRAMINTTQGEGGELEMAKNEGRNMTNHGGEIKMAKNEERKMTNHGGENKMANVAKEPMPNDDMALTMQAHDKAGVNGSHV